MVTRMKTSILHSLIASIFFFYASSSFASRPSELENEHYTPPSDTAAQSLNPRPVEKSAAEKANRVTQIHGDVVQVPANTIRQIGFPRRGMSQEKVQNELGRPIEIVPAVGKPPISQWIYNDRKVYFEYSTVIHVVAK